MGEQQPWDKLGSAGVGDPWLRGGVPVPVPPPSCSCNFWKIAGSCCWHLAHAISSPLSLPEPLPSSGCPGSVPAAPQLHSVTSVFRGYVCAGLCLVPPAVQISIPRLSRGYGETRRLPMGHGTRQDEVFRSDGRRHCLGLLGPVSSARLSGASLEAGQPPLPSCPVGAWSGPAPLTLTQHIPAPWHRVTQQNPTQLLSAKAWLVPGICSPILEASLLPWALSRGYPPLDALPRYGSPSTELLWVRHNLAQLLSPPAKQTHPHQGL